MSARPVLRMPENRLPPEHDDPVTREIRELLQAQDDEHEAVAATLAILDD